LSRYLVRGPPGLVANMGTDPIRDRRHRIRRDHVDEPAFPFEEGQPRRWFFDEARQDALPLDGLGQRWSQAPSTDDEGILTTQARLEADSRTTQDDALE